MDINYEIRGFKGGEEEPYTPYESPDNLQSLSVVKMLIALGEGEFAGYPSEKEIFLNDTPLMSTDGSRNFPNVTWEYRNGSQYQDYIHGFPFIENGYDISHNLTMAIPYVRSINNTNLSAIRLRFRWPQLTSQSTMGDLYGTSVQYVVELSTDGAPYVVVLDDTVTGKTTSGYERSRRIELPDASSGWVIRVRRITPESSTVTVANEMYVTGVTEIIDAKLRYPNTALLYMSFNARQFGSIPKITVKLKGRKWPVPSNYDPDSRTYSGLWDGTFKMEYTNNPVWISYGLMTHERFGLGKRIKAANIDKWEMYRISQYCDEMISDGKGGLEPRFTCNMYIQSRAEAWTVLRDVAAIYRGMVYWSNSTMSSIADMPRDIDYLFTRANVVNGKFSYSGTSERSVYTRAIVAYDNPDNMYNSDATAVYDPVLQRRYGDNLLEITAIGCTSQSEAQRRGQWAIYTNSKNRTVSFQVGLDGNIPMLGHVIGVADPLLAGRNIGGRISEVVSRNTIVLDRKTQAKVGDKLIVNMPTGTVETKTIQTVSEEGKRLVLTSNLSILPEREAQWAIDAQDLVIQQYKVTKIVKDDTHLLTISGVLHDPDKFGIVDGSARREDRPITVVPPSVQKPVTNVTITSASSVQQGMAVTTMTIQWEASEGAAYYDVEWRKDDKEWVSIRRVGGTSFDVQGVYTGGYVARVRAYSTLDVGSVWAQSTLTQIQGKTGAPPVPVNLRTTPQVFGIGVNWNFPENALDTSYTEVQYNTSPSPDAALSLGTFAYPLNTHTMTGLAAGRTFHFRARLVDKTGNVGAWSSWVVGSASAEATEILDYLTDKITETQLGENLLERIDSAGGAQILIDEIKDDLNVMYSIKLGIDNQGRYYGAGMGIGIENTPSGMQSQVLFVADRFAILNDINGTVTSPFLVEAGQVYMNNAVIKDASISFLKIGDDLQSANYVPDVSGWRLGKNGIFEINSMVAGGTARVRLDNKGLKVYETATGVARIEIGELT